MEVLSLVIITVYRYNIRRKECIMTISNLMREKNITRYQLSRHTGIPYSTLTDIISGKTDLSRCSAETVYRIADGLHVSMESLISPYLEKRIPFSLFKSNVCHRLKELGDIPFLIALLEKDDIRKYHERGWYLECFYLLGMLDYISRVNQIPLCSDYDDLRKLKLEKPVYPAGIIALSSVGQNDLVKEKAREQAIPEFMRFNIVESEVRDIV